MEDIIRIPIGGILQLDDVGWDNGRDLRLRGQASRSGLPRYHALEDYQLLHEIGKGMNSSIFVALCLGDWDKDNILRGIVGPTHMPNDWDRKSEINIANCEKYRDTMEESEYVDYALHGLLHGNYDENGKLLNEAEGYKFEIKDGRTVKSLVSDEYFNQHLDLFMQLYESWGFKKPITTYIAPCGMGGISEEDVAHICQMLYDRGIRYWTNSGFPFDAPIKVYNGVACVKQDYSTMLGKFNAPWDAYDVDPETFPQYLQEEKKHNAALLALHWTNILRFNPKKNFEQVAPWVNYFKAQSEVFGFMIARDFEKSVNQLFYFWYADMKIEGNKCILDFTKLDGEKIDRHENLFYLSFRKGTEPKAIEGGEISLYEEHKEFNTYKITHTGSRVTVEFA